MKYPKGFNRNREKVRELERKTKANLRDIAERLVKRLGLIDVPLNDCTKEDLIMNILEWRG